MKILSFDVGIKNLAYCLFSINCCNDNLLKIIKWDVINLCDDTIVSKKYTCSLCKKNAHYYLNATADKEEEEEDIINSTVYCKKHAIQTKLVIYEGDDKSESKCRVKSKSKSTKESSKKMVYPHLKIIVPPKEQNACDVDMIVLGKNLKTKFDLIFSEYNHTPKSPQSNENGNHISGIDAVVIENQIGPLAGRMKMLQGMIAQYFIMMNVDKIEFISATNKLKLFKNIKNENVGNENSYKLRKEKGQHICKSLVTFYPSMKSWNQEFDKHLKKDDLADCFLQGYYYMYSSSVYKKMFAFDLDLFIKGACCEVSPPTPCP
jgi:hypothetical protein